MKEAIRKLVRLAPVTILVRLSMWAIGAALRAASVLKTAALFPHAAELPYCHWSVTVKNAENIRLGQGVVIGPKCTLGATGGITLGDHVRLSEGVMIESAGLDFTRDPPYPHVHRPIFIEEGVWIGAHAVILAGVTVGARSIVGAGAVVSRSVPADTIVAGTGVNQWPRQEGRTHRGER
ncbi:DapH/DapD/GlmU-related protein [Afipia sp. GAS231]|uniref:acyltransferase n=1 Tax=Afipia sp. GAS231 TaxID=1882747 RepID=UPI00087C0435|nr:acyltransferase [Afipia sp. GAS231]SDN36746.1 Hexapeptide repeat of succinyl-transferase [Afipia sp. GAS231]